MFSGLFTLASVSSERAYFQLFLGGKIKYFVFSANIIM